MSAEYCLTCGLTWTRWAGCDDPYHDIPKPSTGLKRTPFRRRTAVGGFPAEVRAVVHQRSEGLCEARTPACTGRAAHLHHILRRSQGGPHTATNALACCRECHEYIHAHPDIAFGEGWLKKGNVA